MRIDFDPEKSARNERERRFIALGALGQRVHVMCFTLVADGVRIISLRKANQREVRRYEQATHG